MAPQAQLVVVAARSSASAIADSAAVLDAIAYVVHQSRRLGRPMVINLSQGDSLGPHDGASALETGIDDLVGGPGCVLVKSVGNDAGLGLHASGVIGKAEQHTVTLRVPAGDTDPDTIDLWYAASDRLHLAVHSPSGGRVSVAPGAQVEAGLTNGNLVFAHHVIGHPGNGDNRVYVQLDPGDAAAVEPGSWTVLVSGAQVEQGRWDAWLERARRMPTFLPPFRDDTMTVTTPGTARAVITVGAYADRGRRRGLLLPISGAGPTRDGRAAPTLAAPGHGIVAARAGSGESATVAHSGTSMAAPHVAGVVALLLQQEPDLDSARVRQLLVESARAGQPADPEPSPAWGAGKLDAAAALQALMQRTR